MNEWVWSIGGMILTGETEVLGEKHYTALVVDEWMNMEHWWNGTDRGNWSGGRKTLYSVGGRWMNEYGALVEWYWQGKLKCWEKSVSQCCCSYRAWHVDCTGTELGSWTETFYDFPRFFNVSVWRSWDILLPYNSLASLAPYSHNLQTRHAVIWLYLTRRTWWT